MSLLPIITGESPLAERLERRGKALAASRQSVAAILNQVRTGGDQALSRLTAEFDGVTVDNPAVPNELLAAGEQSLSDELKTAVQAAAANIRRFHERQLPTGFALTQDDGLEVAWRWRPIQRVGAYVPGGRYPLLSSILMNVIPAQVAGVTEIALCTPPGPSGYPAEAILGVCALLGVDKVYRVGGAQAIAALAYGTESIRAVDKITGPGNAYVSGAKQAVADLVGVDMVAGPTEVLVLADENANAGWVAADLISQAEHDPLAWPILITTSPSLAKEVNRQLPRLLAGLDTRETARQALREQGFIYLDDDLAACVAAANRIAPEHLCLHVIEPESLVDRVRAGAIFLGGQTAVAWGDYLAGPNHILPTAGQARFRGPLSVADFMVPYSVIKAGADVTRAGSDHVQALAKAEGLVGHALSIALREESHA